GVQGEKPSNPELLDWLATEFVRTGWDVKAMHRLIVTSATYRQSSRVTPALAERDPQNRLLARGPRFRPPSWMVRDQALAARGLLGAKAGGPAGKAVPTVRCLGGGDLRHEEVSAGQGGGPLPPQRLHLLAADRRSDDVFRRRGAAGLHCEAGADQHAVARTAG